MVSKKLLFKKVYVKIDVSTVPHLTIEQEKYLLLNHKVGIINGPMEITYFEGIEPESKKFSINFRSIMEGTHQEITFNYKLKT